MVVVGGVVGDVVVVGVGTNAAATLAAAATVAAALVGVVPPGVHEQLEVFPGNTGRRPRSRRGMLLALPQLRLETEDTCKTDGKNIIMSLLP